MVYHLKEARYLVHIDEKVNEVDLRDPMAQRSCQFFVEVVMATKK